MSFWEDYSGWIIIGLIIVFFWFFLEEDEYGRSGGFFD